MAAATAITTMIDGGARGRQLYRLMAWLSPSYPVGAFTYSHGLEWAVEQGDITSLATLTAWLADLLHHGSGRTDAILFACAHRAAAARDLARLQIVNDMALATVSSAERRLETTAQGRAFSDITRAAWASETLTRLGDTIAYPIAVAAAAADHAIPFAPALEAYMHAFTANLVSAAVRLVPLGHTDGQRALHAIEPDIEIACRSARRATLDDLGSAAFLSDIAAMRHETQYTRLFRS